MDQRSVPWIGVGLVVVGLVWIGQALGWIGGGFMGESTSWVVIGAAVVVAGGWVLWRAWGGPRSGGPRPR